MEVIIFQLLRALAPTILSIVNAQFQATGTLPTSTELDAKIVAQRDAAIMKGEDWLKNHPG